MTTPRMTRAEFIKKYDLGGGVFVADDKGGNAASEVAGRSVADYYDEFLGPNARTTEAVGGWENYGTEQPITWGRGKDKNTGEVIALDAWSNVDPHPESMNRSGWEQLGDFAKFAAAAVAMYYGVGFLAEMAGGAGMVTAEGAAAGLGTEGAVIGPQAIEALAAEGVGLTAGGTGAGLTAGGTGSGLTAAAGTGGLGTPLIAAGSGGGAGMYGLAGTGGLGTPLMLAGSGGGAGMTAVGAAAGALSNAGLISAGFSPELLAGMPDAAAIATAGLPSVAEGMTVLEIAKKYGMPALKALGIGAATLAGLQGLKPPEAATNEVAGLAEATEAARAAAAKVEAMFDATRARQQAAPPIYSFKDGAYTLEKEGTNSASIGQTQGKVDRMYAQGGPVSGLSAAATQPRYIQGAGDGLSDDVPVQMDDGKPGRLADGEFVLSADVVSGLGNGSSAAGAKILHTMMDRIRQRSHGHTQQVKPVNPNSVLPA